MWLQDGWGGSLGAGSTATLRINNFRLEHRRLGVHLEIHTSDCDSWLGGSLCYPLRSLLGISGTSVQARKLRTFLRLSCCRLVILGPLTLLPPFRLRMKNSRRFAFGVRTSTPSSRRKQRDASAVKRDSK